MKISLKDKLSSFLSKGHNRTLMARKNVLLSFIVKGISIIISIIIVPLTINYVNAEKYGIWLTVSSIILWFNFFDFGLGNGLRNKLAESIASNNHNETKRLISTAYITLFIISSVLCIIFSFINPYIKWDSILGLNISYRHDLQQLVAVLIFFFCMQFVLQLINTINYAFQKSAVVSFNFLLGSVFSLIFILIFKYTTTGSLLYLGIAYFSGTSLSLLIFNLHFFLIKNRALIPSIKFASIKSSKNILGLGSKFFIIQLAGIVQYESVNVLISRYFSPVRVTEYNIAYKMFNIIMMVFGIIMTPIWSAVTEAQAKGEYAWIKSTEKRLLQIWYGFAILALILLYFSPYIYKLWINDVVHIPFSTSIGVMLYILTMTLGAIYVHILNGLGRIKTQLYISIVTMIIFVPMTYMFAVKLHLGIFGISLGLMFASFNGLVAAPIEYRRFLKSKGIS